jgi:hypothetical protein
MSNALSTRHGTVTPAIWALVVAAKPCPFAKLKSQRDSKGPQPGRMASM